MDFNNPAQHSIANLSRIEATLATGAISGAQALNFASQLTTHGHPSTQQVIAMLRERVRHQEVLSLLDVLERCVVNVRRFFRLEELPSGAREQFYKREGFIYLRKASGSSKLLVIFATMYNNFQIANAAIAQMLRGLDVNLLILKDSSLLNYQRGVAGMASNIPEIATAIQRLARREQISQVYFTGFSSCGYAALLTSLLTRCDGYLGFSQPTDLSGTSPLPPPLFFTEDVRAYVGPEHLLDLKPLLEAADPTVRRTFVYGEANQEDTAHARHLQDLGHIELVAVDAFHNSPERLLADDALLPLFARLIAD